MMYDNQLICTLACTCALNALSICIINKKCTNFCRLLIYSIYRGMVPRFFTSLIYQLCRFRNIIRKLNSRYRCNCNFHPAVRGCRPKFFNCLRIRINYYLLLTVLLINIAVKTIIIKVELLNLILFCIKVIFTA